MSDIKAIAADYFEAFHAGRLEEVLSYFAEDGTVAYGNEPDKAAGDFFPAAVDLVANLKFTTHGIYTSDTISNVIIHFSFQMPTEQAGMTTVDGIDIISFDDNNKIKQVRVITGG